MAEPQEKVDLIDLQDTFLECPICVDFFNHTERRPRLLNTCLHAFCTQCLDQLLKKDGRGQVTCPVCRRVEKVTGTAASLRVDPMRSKLIDFVQMKRKKSIICTECEEKVALSRCKECKCFLCEECDFVHRRHRVSRGHTILSLRDVVNQPLRTLTKEHFCEIHPQHQIEFYCATDGKLCCVSCTVLDHKLHDLQKVREMAEAKKHELEVDIQKMQNLAHHLTNSNVEAQRQEMNIKNTKARSLAEITSMIEGFHKSLDERKDQLIDAVHLRSNSQSTAVQKFIETNEQTLASIESTQTYFTQTKEKADDVETLQIYPSIKSIIGSYSAPEVAPDFEIGIQEFRFQKINANNLAQLVPHLGEVGLCTDENGFALVKGKVICYKVFKTDITQMRVDVIVNGANSHLTNGGGVARTITSTAGQSLQRECIAATQKYGLIPVTHLALTTAGNLPCKTVFHAVGPKWYDYSDKGKCLDDLCYTVLRCFTAANKKGLRSIALPAISCALFGLPKEKCAKTYIRALKSFEKAQPIGSLREVCFVDVSDHMVKLIQDELQKSWGKPVEEAEYSRDLAFIHASTKQDLLEV